VLLKKKIENKKKGAQKAPEKKRVIKKYDLTTKKKEKENCNQLVLNP